MEACCARRRRPGCGISAPDQRDAANRRLAQAARRKRVRCLAHDVPQFIPEAAPVRTLARRSAVRNSGRLTESRKATGFPQLGVTKASRAVKKRPLNGDHSDELG